MRRTGVLAAVLLAVFVAVLVAGFAAVFAAGARGFFAAGVLLAAVFFAGDFLAVFFAADFFTATVLLLGSLEYALRIPQGDT